jgi:outer membrane protein assembly factor BamB
VTALDAKTGGAAGTFDFGEAIQGCVVQIDAFRPTVAAANTPPLAEQLATALLNREAQLATAKRLLLRELAGLQDEDATKTLVELASDERTSPLLMPDARKALADRRTGMRYMIEALGRHYDYLKDVLRPPPVGPIAQALAAVGDKQGAPLLASHLLDPADSDDDVRSAAEALVKLAGPSESAPLAQFFAMYRGTAQNEDIEMAAVSAAQALVTVGGADARSQVRSAMHDPLTLPNVRERLQAVITLPADEPAADAGAPDAAAARKPLPMKK